MTNKDDTIAALAAAAQPVAHVSQETFNDDGTSDITIPTLPIGMALYAAPQPAAQDALAYQEACSLATHLFKKHFSKDVEYASGKVTWVLCDTTAGVISQIDNMVCGLVEPAAQPTLTIKPLQWSDEREPSEDVRYNHVVAESPLGRITVEWKGWKKYDSRCVYVGGEYIDSGSTLEDAKKIAECHLQNVVEALTTAAQAGWCKDCNPDNCCGCATPAGEYPKLPEPAMFGAVDRQGNPVSHGYSASQVLALIDADRAARGAAQAAPVDAAVQQDAERLDFMIESCTQVATISPSGRKYLCYPDGRMQAGSYPTARAAIDAARAAQKGGA